MKLRLLPVVLGDLPAKRPNDYAFVFRISQ